MNAPTDLSAFGLVGFDTKNFPTDNLGQTSRGPLGTDYKVSEDLYLCIVVDHRPHTLTVEQLYPCIWECGGDVFYGWTDAIGGRVLNHKENGLFDEATRETVVGWKRAASEMLVTSLRSA